MSQSKVEIGIVIPIYQTKFIISLVDKIIEFGSRRRFVICIVNDGKVEVADFLAKESWPENVMILNLPENRCFAGANNAGWKYLIEKFPDINYLGTINDDTVPRKNWLDLLLNALENYPKTAIAGPVMEVKEGKGIFGIFARKKHYSVFLMKDDGCIWVKNEIETDTFVPFIGGFCFVARRDALEQVNFFDEDYRNSCEDVDLSLKLRSKGWRLVVCHDSRVFHYGGQSRYLKGTNTDGNKSYALLAEKWGFDLTGFNNLDIEEFLIK